MNTIVKNFLDDLQSKNITDVEIDSNDPQGYVQIQLSKPLKITLSTKTNNLMNFCCDEVGLIPSEGEIDFCIGGHLYCSMKTSIISKISFVFASQRYYRMKCEEYAIEE